MRLHVIGLPHTISNKDYVACAYTQKVVKFCKMMTERGHTVYHYGHEHSDVICTEHVPVVTHEEFTSVYGDEYKTKFFSFDTGDFVYQTFYARTIEAIETRKQKNDIILPFWGAGVRPICDAHPDLITIEPGIGYAGGHWARFKIFESYAIYHAYYGLDSVGTCKQDWYDVVIPNYFDPDDFVTSEKDDYFLFMGRIYEGKGVHVAIQATEAIGAKLIIAGQGNLADMGYDTIPSHVEVVGYADVETRKRLMSRAKGAFVPSMYNEPFGGVQVECLFSGTPTITTDWGAFTENNVHGVTGYRCRTFDEFVWAAKNIGNIDTQACRDWALNNYSLEAVAPLYEDYFQAVLNIYGGKGWYELTDRQEIFRPRNPPKTIDYEHLDTEEEPFAARLADWINARQYRSILDIGCGPGTYTEKIDRAVGIDVITPTKKPCFKYSIFDHPFKNVHLSLMLEVAEHIDPQRSDDIVAAVYASMAKDGVLIFTAARPGQGGEIGRAHV